MDGYAREKEKRDKLVQIYRADDGESLTALINRQIRKAILDGELKRREIERLENSWIISGRGARPYQARRWKR